MRIIEGTSSFLANNTAGIFTSDLKGLDALPEADRNMLLSENGFVTQSIEEANNIIWDISNMTDAYSGATDRVYPLADIGDINMILGKQAAYVMCHPVLKNSYIDGDIDVPGYVLNNEFVGEDDPLYRAVYSGKLTNTGMGFTSKQWLTQVATDLSLNEQMITLANHRLITNDLDEYIGYATVSGKVDVDENGETIKTF